MPEASKGVLAPKTCVAVGKGGYSADFVQAQRLARIALLSAIALVLSYVETMIPLPTALPGVKLGLANVAVVVALFRFDVRTAAAVACVKVLAAGFLFGSPVMLAYSLGGTMLAFASAALLAKVPGISVVVVSMASAIFHNVGQIAVACLMLGTPAILVSLPPLAVAACITGALTGAVAAATLGVPTGTGAFGASRAFSAGRGKGEGRAAKASAAQGPSGSFGVYCAGSTLAHRLDVRTKMLFTCAFFVAAFAAHSAASFLCLVAATVLSLAGSRMGPDVALRMLRPFVWLIALTAVTGVLFGGSGQVLAAAGPFTVTEGGVVFAVESATRFCCLMLGTAALMRTTAPAQLTEGVRILLSPMAKLGVSAETLALALGMTFRFIPLFVAEFQRIKAAQESRLACFSGDVVQRLRSYATAFVPLFASSFRRADAVAFAVQSRAFGAGKRASLQESRMKGIDWAVLVACVVLIVLVSAL